MNITARQVRRRMSFVFYFLIFVVMALFVTAFYAIWNSNQPIEEWLVHIQFVISTLALVVAVVVTLITHGYSGKAVELSERQLEISQEQVELMQQQLDVSRNYLNAIRRRGEGKPD